MLAFQNMCRVSIWLQISALLLSPLLLLIRHTYHRTGWASIYTVGSFESGLICISILISAPGCKCVLNILMFLLSDSAVESSLFCFVSEDF